MGAAAELAAEGVHCLLAYGDHANDVAVLLAEEGGRAHLLGLVNAADRGDDGLGGEDLCVDHALHAVQLVLGHGLEVGEVKAKAVGSHQGAGLVHVVAQDLLEGGVQQVGGRVVAANELATAVVNRGGHDLAQAELALVDHAHVRDQLVVVLGIVDADGAREGLQLAGVANLAAHLAVEGGLVQHDLHLVALDGVVHGLAVLHDGDHAAAAGAVLLVANELGLGNAVVEGGPDVVEGAPGVAIGALAGALLLLLHCLVEGVHVNLVAAVARNLAREVNGEAVGVVQLEGNVAAQDLTLAQLLQLCGKQDLARVQRAREALLLGVDDAVDEGLVLRQLRVDGAHEARDLVRVLGEEGTLDAHEAAVVHGAAEEAAQHVAATLVGGQDAVADHERDGAGVVGHDAQALVRLAGDVVLHACQLLAKANEGAQDVALVVGALVLHDGGHALQAHAGVDVAVRQVGQGTVLLTVVLGEDQVPELQEAVAVVAGLLALEVGALVKVDLRAWAAGAGGAGRPEVVLLAQAGDVVVRDALGVPQLNGLVVVLEDRHVQAILGKAQVLGLRHELVGPGNGVGLGVAAEREVAQHLEEREVTGVTNVVDVVGAQALLAGAGANLLHGLGALVVLLELVHAGVCQQQGRVIGDERGGGVELAALALEELQEVLTNLRRSHGLVVFSAHGSPRSLGGASRHIRFYDRTFDQRTRRDMTRMKSSSSHPSQDLKVLSHVCAKNLKGIAGHEGGYRRLPEQLRVASHQVVGIRPFGRGKNQVVLKVLIHRTILCGKPHIRLVSPHGSSELTHVIDAAPRQLINARRQGVIHHPSLASVDGLCTSSNEIEHIFYGVRGIENGTTPE